MLWIHPKGQVDNLQMGIHSINIKGTLMIGMDFHE